MVGMTSEARNPPCLRHQQREKERGTKCKLCHENDPSW
jgi:hypothetical protein